MASQSFFTRSATCRANPGPRPTGRTSRRSILTSPFGQLSPAGVPQAVGVLLGTPSAQALPINYKGKSWVTIGNFSQYLFVKDHPGAVAEKLGSGQSLRGIGLSGRIGYAPEETNPITRDASGSVVCQWPL